MLFIYNDTATTEIYSLSLHDALPISAVRISAVSAAMHREAGSDTKTAVPLPTTLSSFTSPPCSSTKVRTKDSPSPVPSDRKSTRLNSSHAYISYVVFCLIQNTHYTY